jgi:diguanylate cyclase (GGDEF)-like protein/PAS domain S-box-containing protein
MKRKTKFEVELADPRQHADAQNNQGLKYYTDLYDLAPVGYFKLKSDGTICQANLYGASLLKVEREALIGLRFDQFVREDKQPFFDIYLKQLFSSYTKETFEVEFLIEGKNSGWMQVEAIASERMQECYAAVLDITARKQAENELQNMSMHDALTGLYNRGYFYEAMKQLERSRHFPISIFVADLDHLKQINDKFGHAVGDAMLIRAAQVFAAAFRVEDVTARIGGDEFAVLLPETNAATAALVLQRFYNILQDHNGANPDPPLKLTIGQFTAESNSPLDQSLKLADADLYFRKRERVYPDSEENPSKSLTVVELRHRAEELHNQNYIQTKTPRTDVDMLRLVHELEVHQIELDIQNEELRRSRAEVEDALDRYTDLYDFAPVGYFSLEKDGTIVQANLNGAKLLGVERYHVMGGRFGLFVRDEDRAGFTSFLEKMFASHAKETCELALLHGAKEPLWVQIEGTMIGDGNRCRVVVLDIDARKKAEEQYQAEHAELGRLLEVSDRSRQALERVVEDKQLAEERIRQLNAELEQRVDERTLELLAAVEKLKYSEATIQTLFRISNKLNATLDVDAILDELAQEAIRIVNGESGFAGLRTGDGMKVHKYFWRGVPTPFDYTWPMGQGIPGWVLENRVPYGTSDAVHDPMFQQELAINGDVHSIICTPILDSVGEVLGYFDIRNKLDSESFTISDQDMLMALAPVASIAIQNARAYQQHLLAEEKLKESYERLRALAANLESVREEEQTRISRELHDQLGQALTAMKFDLAWLTTQLATKDDALAKKAKTVTAQMDTMVKTVRRIATELRPAMLDDLGLAASIDWQARDFEKRTGIVCAVSVPAEDLPLTSIQSVALFRILQEMLTNVARHAKAQHIEVKLAAMPDAVTLQIHDDGRGIRPQEIDNLHSLGLLGMRERAMRLGGFFDIRGIPGDGTMVSVSIPVKQKEG